MVIGVVTAVDDPESLGRVKVKFPWLADDYESWWARVAQLGAGPDRGAVWLPEVNDEVLVAFEHGDTRRPYVVGGLCNGVDNPPFGDGLIDGSTGAVQAPRVRVQEEPPPGVPRRRQQERRRAAVRRQQAEDLAQRVDDHDPRHGRRHGRDQRDARRRRSAPTARSASTPATTLELKGDAGVTIDGGPKVDVDGGVIQLN